MLSLLLALMVVTPRDPQIGTILLVCDTPKMSVSCGIYVRGFTDALRAHEYVAAFDTKRNIYLHACLPDEPNLDAIRLGIVRELKEEGTPSVPARVRVLLAISRLHPCH